MGVGQRRAVSEVPNPNGTFQDAGINTSPLQIRLRGTLGAAAGACPLMWGLSGSLVCYFRVQRPECGSGAAGWKEWMSPPAEVLLHQTEASLHFNSTCLLVVLTGSAQMFIFSRSFLKTEADSSLCSLLVPAH